MIGIRGAPALSQFRLDRLLGLLEAQSSKVSALSSRWIHFVDAEELDPRERETLNKLLTYGAREHWAPQQSSTHRILVTPRSGTVSPWSSKATDIVHVCGLTSIRRVERATLYEIACATPLNAAELEAVAAQLHDRMTESVWIDQEQPAALFHHAPARPLRSVALREDGQAALARANAQWGLALSADEIEYLVAAFRQLGRDPTDAELMMFTQANSRSESVV